MYQDNELITCPSCEAKGIFANDLYGKQKFHHKIPSKRVGYFTFTLTHFDECGRCGQNVNPDTHPAIGCDY